jgi:acyl carrier protein
MKPENRDQLDKIFRAVFELGSGQDVSRLRQIDTPAWDSLAHVTLVMGIESELGITLDAADQLRMTSYATTALLLEERGL